MVPQRNVGILGLVGLAALGLGNLASVMDGWQFALQLLGLENWRVENLANALVGLLLIILGLVWFIVWDALGRRAGRVKQAASPEWGALIGEMRDCLVPMYSKIGSPLREEGLPAIFKRLVRNDDAVDSLVRAYAMEWHGVPAHTAFIDLAADAELRGITKADARLAWTLFQLAYSNLLCVTGLFLTYVETHPAGLPAEAHSMRTRLKVADGLFNRQRYLQLEGKVVTLVTKETAASMAAAKVVA